MPIDRPFLERQSRPTRSKRRKGALGVLGFLAVAACGASGGQTQAAVSEASEGGQRESTASQERLPPRGEGWVIFGKDTVRVELARTPEEREQGLMYRETLEKGRGMLFVFNDSQIRSFWMLNTMIPLDIAYIDENLTIIDIQAMEPQTEDPHPSARPAMFALEVPLGWFAEMGIGVGTQAQVVFGPG